MKGNSIMSNSASRWPVPFLFGGRLCLDFVNTVNSRSRPATKDYLQDWKALIGWCRQASLFDAAALARLEAEAAAAPARASDTHTQALELREVLYRIFSALIDGANPPSAELGYLDDTLRAARQRQALTRTEAGFAWQWDVGRLDLSAPLHAVALSAGDLLTGDGLRRLKECPGPEGCGWLFFDETRNGSRRWCSMEHCGSTAKARRYAARHGAQRTSASARKPESAFGKHDA